MSLPKGAIKKQSTKDIMKAPFVMFQAHADDYQAMTQFPLTGVQEKSVLAEAFFHPKNIAFLQRKIIAEVFGRTRGEYLIEKQNAEDLLVVMRGIFIQNARHLPYKIREQIVELNDLVVEEVTPGILSEINAYVGYLDRTFGPAQVLDRPVNVSNAGRKTLPSVTQRFDSN